MKLEDEFDSTWVCPKMTCSSFLVFNNPYLPCAKHGDMVREDQISYRKKLYRYLRRQS